MSAPARALGGAAAWLVVAAAVLVAGCSGGDSDTAKASPRPPAVPVSVVEVTPRDVPVRLHAIGNVQAFATVSVLSQVGGQVFEIHFTEGQDVKTGDLLFSIDPRPFQTALLQAQAQLAQHQAQVGQAQANLARDTAQYENARVGEERYKRLVEGGYVAREQYEQMRTNEQSLAATLIADRAAVETARSVVRADEAAVDNARVQLSYTEIRSPIDGRTGNLLIHKGNVVKSLDVGNPLVVINRVHPVSVTFAVPEQYLDQVKRYRAAGELRVEAKAPGADRAAQGDLSFLNNSVDPATGTIQLKATFPNADNALWPGQFVNVVLTLTTERGALVVPSQAVQPGQQGGAYVFVVKPDLTAENRPVTVAFAEGSHAVIAKGLAAGERVVTDGQLRLVPGVRVEIKAPGSAGPAPKGSAAPQGRTE